VEEQTRLIGRDSVNAQVGGHTHLGGAVIAAENGDLSFDTQTLSFSDLYDRDREKSYYANVSLTFSGDNAQQESNNRATNQPVRSGRQEDGSAGLGGTFSGYYNNHDYRQINRATIGAGSVIVRADQGTGRDSISGLNRDLAQAQVITRDREQETTMYVSDSSLSTLRGMFASDDPDTRISENTFGRWKDEFNEYGRNTVRTYHMLDALGRIESDNKFIGGMSRIVKGYNDSVNLIDGLGKFSTGLIPGVKSHGGLMGQAPALIVGDQFFYRMRAPLTTDPETGGLIVDINKAELLGEVDRPSNGDYISINGIMTDLNGAIHNGAMHTGSVEFIVAYNPSHGFLSDTGETFWDIHAGGLIRSGNARQLNQFYDEGLKMGHSFNLAAHSQGVALLYRSIQGLDFTAKDTIKPGTVLASGGPIKAESFMRAAELAGFGSPTEDQESQSYNRVLFQMHEFEDRKNMLGGPVVDPVSATPILLGGNYDSTRFWAIYDGVASIPYLSGADSVHGNYVCWGETCAKGELRQPALEAVRPNLWRPIFIDADGKRERAK